MALWVDMASRPDWLQTDWVLKQFGSTHCKAVMGYMDFVRAGAGQPGVWNPCAARFISARRRSWSECKC
jgi:hypothetical protein